MQIVGILKITKRLKSSRNGNPRWQFTIGTMSFKTPPDSSIGYEIDNYHGHEVVADFTKRRGSWSIDTVSEVAKR